MKEELGTLELWKLEIGLPLGLTTTRCVEKYFNFYFGKGDIRPPSDPHCAVGLQGVLVAPCFIYAQTTMHFSEMRWIDAVVQWLRSRSIKCDFGVKVKVPGSNPGKGSPKKHCRCSSAEERLKPRPSPLRPSQVCQVVGYPLITGRT
jgi:hypothetical protein